jgi:hypothetical protein
MPIFGSLTKVLGIIAWGAVAFIVIVGVARGEDFSDVLLLGTAMAISAIPTGMPAFVSGLLSMGAKQLADAKAVVKNLTDVETLGATSAINTDKTGTLTMNQMMVSVVYANGSWFSVEGDGYRKSGAIKAVAGVPVPDFTNLALGMVLDSDATVADDGAVVGDPTEGALVVLAAKGGLDVDATRSDFPRIAELPFDSGDCGRHAVGAHHVHADHDCLSAARADLRGQSLATFDAPAGQPDLGAGCRQRQREVAAKAAERARDQRTAATDRGVVHGLALRPHRAGVELRPLVLYDRAVGAIGMTRIEQWRLARLSTRSLAFGASRVDGLERGGRDRA